MRVLLPMSGETCLAFDARSGWHLLAPAPSWWLDEQEQRLAEDEERLNPSDLDLTAGELRPTVPA